LRALIVADGDVPTRAALDRLLGTRDIAVIVAADGGATKAIALGLRPDVVVGDQDSIALATVQQLRDEGVEVRVHPAAKDESDTELAVREAVGRGATELVVVGAFGGARLEHTLANVLLLALPELRGLDVTLADGSSAVRLLYGGASLTLKGRATDFVSLHPLSAVVEGVTTDGLEYALVDEPLNQGPARGLSNVMTAELATVSARSGRLLVVHTRNEQ
jgi:thiamine pyrophosphokinase